jgi:hypothetical protein
MERGRSQNRPKDGSAADDEQPTTDRARDRV